MYIYLLIYLFIVILFIYLYIYFKKNKMVGFWGGTNYVMEIYQIYKRQHWFFLGG
jgi:hypothetical protein